MIKNKSFKGALLLEVLIAVTVLAIGIISCLHIFSAALFTTQHIATSRQVQADMSQVLYPWFLDPTSVGGVSTLSSEGLGLSERSYRFYVRTEPIVMERSEEEQSVEGENQEQKQPGIQQTMNPFEFFRTQFSAQRKDGKSFYQLETYLFRYGNPKQITS